MTRRYEEIPVDSIETTRIQARQEDIYKNVSKLVQNIETNGLFSPILVVEAVDGKYELIAGQRRMLAYRELLKTSDTFSKIPAFVYENLKDWQKAAMSINENFNQEPLTEDDKNAAVTASYNMFDNKKSVSKETGISQHHITKYVKFDRLPQVLRELKTSGYITLSTALDTADLFNITTPDIGNVPEDEIKKCALTIEKLTPKQKNNTKRLKDETSTKPNAPTPIEIIKKVKEKKEQTHEIKVVIYSDTYSKLIEYRDEMEFETIPLAATHLIDEGCKNH